MSFIGFAEREFFKPQMSKFFGVTFGRIAMH